MRWVWTTIALAGMPACFYVDPINERPSADIDQVNPELPYRGDAITVTPHIVEPDHDTTTVEWRAYACYAVCDTSPYDSATTPVFSVVAPKTTLDGHFPATGVHIELDVADEWGAQAQPTQTLDLPLGDHDPVFAVNAVELDSEYAAGHNGPFPIGTPTAIHVHADDTDDPTTLVFADPIVYPPAGFTLDDATLTRTDDDDVDGTSDWELVAQAPGEWQVQYEVTDPLDQPGERHHATTTAHVQVDPDQEPCITASDPTFTPSGARIIVDALRHFSIVAVDDDLDSYPAETNELNGTASFRWYLDGQQLNVDGNFVEIDPSLYTPGTQLSLRVEAVDREDQPLCDSSLDTCEDRPGCFQRETWYLEAR